MLGIDVDKVIVSKSVMFQTLEFIKMQGTKGFEARVYWVGKLNNRVANVYRTIIPDQMPYKSIFGVSVTVSQEANIKVAKELKGEEYIVAKVHSHPREAYISEVDELNPFLRHKGAISIVVPDFGRKGMALLSNCAVGEFRDKDWILLNQGEIEKNFAFE